VEFFNMLTGPELLELTEAHLPEHRERLYSPTVTLSMFMRHALNEDGSCQNVLDRNHLQLNRHQTKRFDGSRSIQLGRPYHLCPENRLAWLCHDFG
jgi:hypothetical protein